MIDPKRLVAVGRLVELAGQLAEEFNDGVNPEYDRALVELIVDAGGGRMDEDREAVRSLIADARDRFYRRRAAGRRADDDYPRDPVGPGCGGGADG